MVADIRFSASSLLASGSQSYPLSSLISVTIAAAPASVLAIRVYDRDAYSGAQSYDYGHFNSANGGRISAGTQYHPTTLYFDLHNGQYLSRDTGEALSSYNFTPSDQNYRSVYLSLFTSGVAGATYDSAWLDPSWNHLSDLNVVTRTDYIDATPNVATAEEIAALAKSFIGKVWNAEGCWLLTSNISAAAGASLPVASARLGTPDLNGNGQWQVVWNGAQQNGDWRALLQPGDIVELGWYNGLAHIATVTSGSGHSALWVDNSGPSANDGVAADIVIQGEHSVDDATASAVNSSVVVFRLATATATATAVPAPIAPPVITAHAQSIQVGRSLSLASLFSVQDPNLLPTVSYQIIDHNGGGHIQLNGATNLASAAQQQAGTVTVSASDLPKLSYVASLGPDSLTITAFNGQGWGSVNVVVTGWVDPPPTASGASISLHATSQLLAAASLFTVAATPGHTISQYRFIDTDHTGQLVLGDPRANLASNEEAAQGIYRVAASDLGTVAWRVLADSGSFSVAAFDGVQWSDYAAVTVAGLNNAPLVTALARTTLSVGQPVSIASLFSLSDSDSDPLALVSVYDFYENVQLNGAHDYCLDPHTYQVKFSDLDKLTYTAPSVMGGLQGISVYASDGTSWSRPTTVLFTIADPHPIVEPTAATQLALDQAVPLAQMFRAVDPNGLAIIQYQVHDPAAGGSIQLNGASNLASAAQQAQGIAVFAASDLGRVSYVGASQVGSETLTVSAYNGTLWGSTSVAVYSSDSASPLLRAQPVTLDVGQTVQLADLCSASTPSGKPISQYLIRDPAAAGTLLLNGAVELAAPGQAGVLIAAADFAKLQYLAAATDSSEALGISAFDGTSWGQAELSISSRNFNRPVVTTIPLTVHAGQALSLQDLFRVSDANGNSIRYYQIDDAGQHLQLNGATNIYAAQQYQGIYGIDGRDLAKIVFVAGAPGIETIYVEATDIQNSSMMVPETITVLPNPVITPTTVALAIRETLPLSSLFVADNPSGKAILEYKITDPDGGGTVYLNGAANLASASEQAQGIAIVAAADLGKLSYKGAASFGTETLVAAAYDGDSWGAADVPVTTIDGAAPSISAPQTRVEVVATIALAGLFSVISHSGQPITLYRFADPIGGGKLLLNGATNLATPAQQAQEGMAIVAAADIDKLRYVGADAPGSETLSVAAYDGQSWGSANLTIASLRSAAPVVTPAIAFLEPGQSVGLTSLFAVTDANGQAISDYIFQDPDNNIRLNGATNLWAAQQSSGYYWIRAADIASVSYVASRDGVFHFSVIVNDGLGYSSWTNGTAVVGKDRLSLPPAVTSAETTVPLGQPVQLAALFSTQDPIGSAISQYSVRDPADGGSLVLNGATDLASASQRAAGLVVFAAADLAKVQYQGAAAVATEVLSVAAYNGLAWGSADIAVTSAALPPLVSAAKTTLELGHTLSLSDIFAVATSSGNALSQYKIQDPHGGGTILLNGARNLADVAQQAQGISIFSAQDLAQVQYAAAAAASTETLAISASDGRSWGSSNIAVTTSDNRPPTLSQTGTAVDLGETVWLSNFFAGTSVSGKPILQYLIEDPSAGGTVNLNTARDLASAAQRAQGIMVVAAYDLGAVLYTGAASAGSETLAVTAYDGQNSTSSSVSINSVSAVPPLVAAITAVVHAGESVSLSHLFSITESNGFAVQHYVVTDPALGVSLNGAANGFTSPTWDYQGHYYLAAADWNKVLYAAQAPGTVRVAIQVDDGHNMSAYVEETIIVVAGSGQDSYLGGAGNDTLAGGAADDALDGGGGVNTVVYGGAHSRYAITKTATGYSVTDKAGSEGTDTLSNIQCLKFADATIALTVDGANAGSDSAASYNAIVEKLYVGYFGRPADPAGLQNASAQLSAAHAPTTLRAFVDAYDSNASVRQIIDTLSSSAESGRLYGGSNADFVDAIFQNLFGRAPAATFWVDALNDNALSRSQAALNIMAAAETNTTAQGMLDATAIANKIVIADNFTRNIVAPSGYTGSVAAAAARTLLHSVDAATNVIDFQSAVDATLIGLGAEPIHA